MSSEPDVRAEVEAFLQQSRNEVRLPAALVEALVNYLVDGVGIQAVAELVLKSMKATAEEAWADSHDGSDLPAMHADKLAQWLAPPSSALHEVDAVSSRSFEGDGKPLTEDELRLFGEAGPTARDKSMMMLDKAKQGLSGLRIIMLALALELGRVPSGGSAVAAVFYNSDPRLSEMAKQARKAGLATLSKVLDSGDISRLTIFIMGLIRDYSERGMVTEAQLLTTWWNETNSVCGGNMAVIAKYVRQYLDKYVGRGLPEPVDQLIIMRLGSGGDTGAEALKMAKEAKSKADKAAEEASNLKAKVTRLEAELARSRREAGPSIGTFKGKCHYCQEEGHRVSECPQKKADKAAKEAGKGEEEE